jgi:hypothetical protein
MNYATSIDNMYLLLRMDAQEYQRSKGISAKALARHCGIPDRLLRGMDSDDWLPTMQTLLRVEKALEHSDGWPATRQESWRESRSSDGFAYCRTKSMSDNDRDNFSEVLSIFDGGSGADRKLSDISQLRNVTIFNAASDNPFLYSIAKHAEVSVAAGGVDATGTELLNYRVQPYRDILIQDCARVRHSGHAVFSDILWGGKGTTAGSFFQRLLLPFGDHIASAVNLRLTALDVGLEYSARISCFDAWVRYSTVWRGPQEQGPFMQSV